ncbi:MAG: type I secretion system permease/ATPase [Hellea sp.]
MSSQTSKRSAGKAPLQLAVKEAKGDWFSVAMFSFGINLLMLTGPLFMLQVYDRVLTSRSIPTLVVLWALIVALFGFLGLFNFFRTRILSRVGYRIDTEMMVHAQKLRIVQGLSQAKEKVQPVADLARVRQFIGSAGLTAFFDLPWVPIFLVAVFIMHPWLGWLTVAGVIVITIFTIANELLTKNPIMESTKWDVESSNFSESSRRSAEAVVSMGMMGNVLSYWERLRHNSLSEGQRAASSSEVFMSISKAIRLLLQSSILGLGAYLAVLQIVTPGTMIAASIIGGRALSPIDQVIANWRNFVGARQAYARLNLVLAGKGEAPELIQLPVPKGHLDVRNVVKMKPAEAGGDGDTILQGINFSLEPGDALGVVGPSASGKSSLARLLTGLWMPERGSVRLDGATYDQWDSDLLGQHIGYLPQSAQLMRGSIKANIARFDPQASDENVIAAAQMANVHHLIMALPGGYEAVVGENVVLSGGQVQRIALACAIYNTPALVILDEPNSNLDAEGDAALTKAITALREAGSTVVVMAHRPSAIAAVNKLLMIREGVQVEFGPKKEVLAKITKAANTQAVQRPVTLSPGGAT